MINNFVFIAKEFYGICTFCFLPFCIFQILWIKHYSYFFFKVITHYIVDFLLVKLITFSRIVTHFLHTQNLKLSLKKLLCVFKITFLWNSSLSMKLPVYEKSSLSMKCTVCMESPIYEMSYPWISFSMKCPIYEISCLWNFFLWNDPCTYQFSL